MRNGRELLYREGDRIMSVTYSAKGNAFAADKPRVYLEKAGLEWDVAPDGRIAVIEPVPPQPGDAPSAEHHVVFLGTLPRRSKKKKKKKKRKVK